MLKRETQIRQETEEKEQIQKARSENREGTLKFKTKRTQETLKSKTEESKRGTETGHLKQTTVIEGTTVKIEGE